MRHLLSLAVITSAAVAHAEAPDRHVNGYLVAGAITGKDRYEFKGAALELGLRLAHSPVFVRGMANAGATGGAGSGGYWQVRGGVEGRRCSPTGMVCGSLGVDLGIHRATWTPFVDRADPGLRKPAIDDGLDDGRFDSVVVVPRLTIDGGGQVRVRGIVEVPQHLRDGERVSGLAMLIVLGIGWR